MGVKKQVSILRREYSKLNKTRNNVRVRFLNPIRGNEFTYIVKGNCILLSTTNPQMSKGMLEPALKHFPLENTVPLQYLQAPSYFCHFNG